MKALKLLVALCIVAGFSANNGSAQTNWSQNVASYVPCLNYLFAGDVDGTLTINKNGNWHAVGYGYATGVYPVGWKFWKWEWATYELKIVGNGFTKVKKDGGVGHSVLSCTLTVDGWYSIEGSIVGHLVINADGIAEFRLGETTWICTEEPPIDE